MKDQLLLLSTCGTSLLTYDCDSDTRKWLNNISNHHELEEEDQKKLDKHLEKRRSAFLKADAEQQRKMSAEWNGISSVLSSRKPRHVQHLLVHTDTALGRAAMEPVYQLLLQQRQDVQLLTAGGLRTSNQAEFRSALSELTHKLEEWMCWQEKGWEVVFNLTGGFKSINAYLQAFGSFHADSCVFLFERSSELMEIPRLPARLSEVDDLREHIDVFRRLEVGYPVSREEAEKVPESLLLELDGEVATSVWGDLVWSRTRKKLMAERLFEPLSSKVKVGDAVVKKFEGLPMDRRLLINEKLDAFCARHDGLRGSLKSETFKKLTGKPAPPSTHELYAWSDRDAARLLGHYEGGVFVFDALVPHLQ